MHYLLIYDAAPEYMERRAEYRRDHLAHAWDALREGSLVLAGAFGDPVEGAVLLFQAESSEVPRRFAMNDPYVLNGLVREWRVRPWHTVVGNNAENPVAPDEA